MSDMPQEHQVSLKEIKELQKGSRAESYLESLRLEDPNIYYVERVMREMTRGGHKGYLVKWRGFK